MFDLETREDARVRVHNIVKEYAYIPQGDVNLVALPNLEEGRAHLEKMLQKPKSWGPNFKFGKIGAKTRELQLAPGTSIGSRHCIAAQDAHKVQVFAPGEGASSLEGPVLVATQRFTLEHPKHGNHSIPEGTYQVLFQRDMRFDSLTRVRD